MHIDGVFFMVDSRQGATRILHIVDDDVLDSKEMNMRIHDMF